MNKENSKTLEIVIGKPTPLPSSKWFVAMSLDGNCLDDVESVEVSDDTQTKKRSSDKNMGFYVDFETDTCDNHKLNYQINFLNQPSINITIELKRKQQVVTIFPEETVEDKRLSVIQATKAVGVLGNSTGEIDEGNEQLPKRMAPFALVQEAIKAVPAVKYALGIGGIIAIIAIVRGFGLDFRIAGFGAFIMMILMMLLVIFARASALTIKSLQIPALIFTWFILILFMLVSLTLFSCVFFQRPVDLQYWIGK